MRDKQRLTVGIALAVALGVTLGPARADEQQRRVKLHVAGSTIDGVLDTDGDGTLARVQNGIANGKPEQFLMQRETEFKDTATPCQMPDGTPGLVRLLLQSRSVYTSMRDGNQFFTQTTPGPGCLNPQTGEFSFTLPGSFIGGTGRYAGATGTWETQNFQTVALIEDPQGHAFRQFSFDLVGTLILP